MSACVQCIDLAAGYDGVPVVRDFDLEMSAGEIVALLGPNGAGKTTTLLTIAGLLPPVSGEVLLWGQRIPDGQPHRVARQGLTLVSDDRALFAALTVRENLEVARRRDGASIAEILDFFPALRQRIDIRAGMISGGEQQMLALARALIQQPRVLLVDEMSTGLAPLVVRDMFDILVRIARDSGVAVILVEQHIDLALTHADRAFVLVHGDVTFSGSAAEARENRARIESAYLGTVSP